MNWTPLPPGHPALANIEDRRAQNPNVVPSAPDALLRGLPQTPHEFELYKQKLEREAAYKAGMQVPPQAEAMLPGLSPELVPSKGDPAGLEARRAAIMERLKADQAALDELDLRLNALKTRTARKP